MLSLAGSLSGSGRCHAVTVRERYSHGHHDSVLRSHRWRTAANSAGFLLAELRPGLDVLDVGCGPGTISIDLARRVPGGRVVGIDRSFEAVVAARQAAGAAAVPVTFETGDAYQLPFPAGTFDVVHAHQVLQHLADPVAALREMRRVCRPGGLVAARDADYAAMAWYPPEPALDRWLDLYCRVARANGGEPAAGRRIAFWAGSAGFERVTPSVSTWLFASEGDRAWWGGTWAERMTTSDVAARAVELGEATPGELAELAAGWRRWAATPDGWFAVLHGEVLCRT